MLTRCRRFERVVATTVVALAVAVGWLPASQAALGQTTARKPHIVFVVGTPHYSPEKSMPLLAKQMQAYGFRTTVVLPNGNPEHNKNNEGIVGLEVLGQADAAVFYLRFLELPEDQLRQIVKYVESGKPVIGLRTSTHAFAYPKGHRFEKWNDGFGRDVLGSKYFIHLQGTTEVKFVPRSRGHVILNRVASKFTDPGTLYKVELPADATPLLMGTGASKKIGTVTNPFGTHQLKSQMSWPVAWTWKNQWGGRVFATTIGHVDSFQLDAVNRLLVNGIHWAMNRPVDASLQRRAVESANKRLKRPVGLLTDHDPEIERKSFQMLPGFEVNLFAAEPMLVNPIHMTFDPRGRLWVCCSTSYPQLNPGEEPNDQIVVLEDTNGDGRADESTVFAEGLQVPTGLELGDGGVYVANAPDLLFLKDTDGDGVADLREVVLTGFATEDNHHSISAWRWGPGGWLYFQEGTFMHSQVETPHGPVRLEYGGVFQFRPRDMRLRVFADYRASNPWGHMFDRWGQSIVIDNPRLYFSAPLTANSRAKLSFEASGSGTKQAGGEFTSGRHLPPEFRGQIWTNQYKSHVVARYGVSDDGAGYSIKGLPPLIQSSSPYFRPVDLKMGPDGAAYILDWYNPLIGHMQHSFRDERRDTTHGRVWRVTYKGRPLVKRPRLVGVPLAELLEHLKDPEGFARHQVKRVLYDTDPTIASAALSQWVAALDPTHEDFEHHRLEALWCYQTIDVVNEPLLRQVSQSNDARARAAAVRVLRYWHDRLADPLSLLASAISDAHPRVRLEAVLTLGFVPAKESVTIAVRAIDKPTDRYINHALKLTVDGLQPHWLAAYRAGELRFDRVEHRNYALSNLLTNESIDVLIEMLNSGSIDPALLSGPAEAVAQTANANQLEPLVLTLSDVTREFSTRGRDGVSPTGLAIILEALDRAARQRDVVPLGNLGTMISRCYSVPDRRVQVATTRLVGAWKIGKEAKRLQGVASSQQADHQIRIAAVEALATIGGKSNLAFVRRLTRQDRAVDDRYLGVIGLAAADVSQAAPLAALVLSADPAEANPSEVIDAFLKRKGGVDALAAALETTRPHPRVASFAMQHLIEIGQQHGDLVKIFGGEVTADSLEARLLREDAKQLAAEVLQHGSPHRGELIFRRQGLACATCHGISKAGSVLGPDLAAIGSSSPPDYIVDSLLRPSKVIKEFYESVMIVTDEGLVINGILAFQDNDKMVVRDASRHGESITIATSQIELVKTTPSLMPTGLANKLNNRQEFLDLTRFITELGRPGPYATSVAQVVRRWRVGQIDGDSSSVDSARIDDVLAGGSPAYSMVSGTLPVESLGGPAPLTIAAAQIDVTAAGKVYLNLNSTEGLAVLVNGEPTPAVRRVAIDLPLGRSSLGLVIDRARRGDRGLRVELTDVAGSPARYKVVGGR